MKTKFYLFLFVPMVIGLGILVLLAGSCKKENNKPEEPPVPQIPVITTNAPMNILQTMAQSGGEVTSDGGATITARGVVWGTSPLPTVDLNTKTLNGTGTGKFISQITGLTPNTMYYVRAYAKNSVGTSYGGTTALYFTTLPLAAGLAKDTVGNYYQTITVGTQTWMAENLKTTKYRDGSAIPNVTDNTAWGVLTTGAYCNYDNNVKNGDMYGRLYNWYAVADSRNIAPKGWHVATDAEWTTLMNYLGGVAVAGAKLKESGMLHWYGANLFATNEVGFTALPGDFRPSTGIIIFHLFSSGYWWSATPVSATSTTAYYYWLPYYDKLATRASTDKKVGHSVRCVKDI